MDGFYFDSSARSALGLVRSGNEDSAFISGRLIAVADGMGGHAGGEIASKIAIKTLQGLMPMLTNTAIDPDSIEDLLLNSLYTVDSEIGNYAHEAIELRGMGTTLTALLSHNNLIALLHIGDSRCYRLRGNNFEQLSNDHTVIQELLSQGAISETEALDHPQRSVLTQALMGDSGIDPLLHIFEAKVGDHFLLCSDGLNSVLSDYEIAVIIKKNVPENVVNALIDAVYLNGAPDNVTIVWSEIVTTESEEEVIVLGAAL